MIYRLPELGDKDILHEYIQEHFDHNERSISASLELTSSDFSEWVEKIRKNSLDGDSSWGRSLLYLCFDEDWLVGLLSIRYELPPHLSEKLGDIGYGVRPSERQKGYATAMLEHAMRVCRTKGKKRVLVGCYKSNVASEATIKKCGGVLYAENCNYKQDKVSRYYTIEL